MRLSPWHLEIAKRMAQGKKDNEIRNEIAVSQNRLSILKANPLFQQEIDRYRKIEDEKYKKAVDVFARKAEQVAERITEIATQKSGRDADTLKAGELVLNRLQQAEGFVGMDDTEELTFEQTLRVVKRNRSGDCDMSHVLDPKQALEELQDDLEYETNESLPHSDIIEMSKKTMAFVSEVRDSLEKGPVPTRKDNGGREDRYAISPRLKALLGEVKQ